MKKFSSFIWTMLRHAGWDMVIFALVNSSDFVLSHSHLYVHTYRKLFFYRFLYTNQKMGTKELWTFDMADIWI